MAPTYQPSGSQSDLGVSGTFGGLGLSRGGLYKGFGFRVQGLLGFKGSLEGFRALGLFIIRASGLGFSGLFKGFGFKASGALCKGFGFRV